MNKIRKIYCILLAMLLVLSISACGKTNDEPKNNSEESNVTSTDQPVDTKEDEIPESDEQTDVKEEVPAENQPTDESLFSVNPLDDNTCSIVGCQSNDAVIVVPETINGMTVIELGEKAFPNKKETVKIVLPDSINAIGEQAFVNCEKLEEILFGTSLKKVGSQAFLNCSALKTVAFPEGVKELEGPVFALCGKLEEVYVPGTVTTIVEPGIAFIQHSPNIVIVTPAGSVAEASAKESGLPVRNP